VCEPDQLLFTHIIRSYCVEKFLLVEQLLGKLSTAAENPIHRGFHQGEALYAIRVVDRKTERNLGTMQPPSNIGLIDGQVLRVFSSSVISKFTE
jgi:hypothetical protein